MVGKEAADDEADGNVRLFRRLIFRRFTDRLFAYRRCSTAVPPYCDSRLGSPDWGTGGCTASGWRGGRLPRCSSLLMRAS